jgi:hypothetical protein
MSAVKEPHFFNTDDRRFISTLEAYENLFRDASRSYCAVGDASVWYLSSTEAVQNILAYQPDARFIVMVRNPVEMAPALHAQMLISGHENVHNFSAAWHYQEERRQGRQRSVGRDGDFFTATYASSEPNSSGYFRPFLPAAC